jgi:hypothetical protein
VIVSCGVLMPPNLSENAGNRRRSFPLPMGVIQYRRS